MTDFAKLMGLDPAVAGTLVKDVYGPGSAFMEAGAVGGVTEENMHSRAYRAAEFSAKKDRQQKQCKLDVRTCNNGGAAWRWRIESGGRLRLPSCKGSCLV